MPDSPFSGGSLGTRLEDYLERILFVHLMAKTEQILTKNSLTMYNYMYASVAHAQRGIR